MEPCWSRIAHACSTEWRGDGTAVSSVKPRQGGERFPHVLRRGLLGLAVLLLALGAFASWGAVASLWDLRQVRLHGHPPARTAQEDYATSEYWLDFFARLNGAVGGVSFLSAAAVLWLRSRVRR